MKQFVSFIKKEFLHILRDPRTLMILMAMPLVQLIIFGYAITTEINNSPMAVLDENKGVESLALIEQFSKSTYFNLVSTPNNIAETEEAFQRGQIKLALIITPSFGNDFLNGNIPQVQVLCDATEPNEANTVSKYAQQIIMQYQTRVHNNIEMPFMIHTNIRMLYNPQLKGAYNFVPGIMGLILMLICAMMTSISIVREKEQGTMEVLLVSPIKPIFIIFSKAIPYFVIALADVIGILLLSYFLLDVPIVGSIVSILFLSILFIISALALGMLISSVTSSQQAAMLISGVGLMLPTMMLSGLIFPIENMPLPLQVISNIIPAKWFIIAIKDVMIKGLPLFAIWEECLILAAMSIVLLTASLKRFKNRL
ncbi:ABC transporter permease [Bacteroidales bacterium]|nr:ABC transporter permease [Bacteroidales bacterium]